MAPKILVLGFYGYDNTGDELILHGMVDTLRRTIPGAVITVCSAQPEQTERRFGVKAVFAGRRLSGLAPLIQAMRGTDLFILGGGGLLQDRERRIIPYWLSRVVLAKLLGKRVMFYAQGIGPIATPLGRRLVRHIGNRVDLITVRDPESAVLLRALPVTRPPVAVTADPALALSLPARAANRQVLVDLGIPDDARPLVGIAVRPWPGGEAMEPALAALVDSLTAELGARVVFIPMQAPGDEEVSERIAQLTAERGAVHIVRGQMEPLTVARIIGGMDLVIGMRLHAVILAAAQGVPVAAIAYDPKVANFARRVGLADYLCDLEQVRSGALTGIVRSLWANRGQVRAELGRKAGELCRLAEKNGQLARELLER